MVIMEDNTTKAAIVQQHRGGTRIGDGNTDTSISPPNAEITILSLNNTNAESSASPSVSPMSATEGGQTSPNQNVYLIGLEFVRQYYTVLHQGPLYLHRFYSEQSSFVHDDSKVVYGQQEIRDRIEQLNFRNCVAKILQVDSQETLGNGVVIQVRGELSNNGKPLRRFMQTFVLAPQSPKRYYVRNDIFHYQDDENCKDDLSDQLDSRLPNEHEEEEGSEEVEDEELNDSGSHVPSVSAGSPASSTETPTLVSNQPENPPPVEPAPETQVPEVSLLDTKPEQKVESQQRRPSHGFITSGASVGGDNGGSSRGPEPAKEPEQATPQPSAPPTGGIKTYANLFKSDLTPAASSGTHEFSPSRSPFPSKPVTGRLGPSPTAPPAEGEAASSVSPAALSPQPTADAAGKTLPPRGQNNFGRGGDRDRGYGGGYRRERLTSRSSNATANDETGSMDGDSRRSIHNYPDSHQLFVGNLPHTVTIEEVKGIFEVYGRVPEVKILKPNQKNSGPKVPYFCFVVFEEQAAAEAAIRDKQKITMRMPDGVNRRLNVEEKRPREVGPGYGGGPPGGGYFPREPRGENMSAGVGGPGGAQQGTGNNNFRSGGGRGGGMAGAAGGNKELSGNEYRSSQQNNPRTHSRTFRGSNRGGGGGSGGADRGGAR